MTVTTVGVAVALPVACWLATAVRRVHDGRRVLVVRHGVVRRVYEQGLALRMPFVERFAHHDPSTRRLPLVIRATTRDDTPIVLLGEATVSLATPRAGDGYADPWIAAETVAQETIARAAASWRVCDVSRQAATARAQLRHAVSAAVDEHGVALLELDLAEVHLPLVHRASEHGRT